MSPSKSLKLTYSIIQEGVLEKVLYYLLYRNMIILLAKEDNCFFLPEKYEFLVEEIWRVLDAKWDKILLVFIVYAH